MDHRFEVEARADEWTAPHRLAVAGREVVEHHHIRRRARAERAELGAAGEEFQTRVAPEMAAALGMTAEEFGAMTQTNFPAVATGMEVLRRSSTKLCGHCPSLRSPGDSGPIRPVRIGTVGVDPSESGSPRVVAVAAEFFAVHGGSRWVRDTRPA